MADVRALLRQQRAARRIEHPHAAYSDAGKLLCVVCHEHIKAETLWDGHIRGIGHRGRLQALQQSSAAASKINGGSGTAEASGSGAPSNKRKIDEDEEMADPVADEDAVRRKRSRPDITLGGNEAKKDEVKTNGTAKPLTPPLTRRQSGTPTLGVEMQIPSRPATPIAPRETGSNPSSASGTSSTTTPKAPPVGRSPLIQQEATAAQLPPQTRGSNTSGASSISTAPIDDVWAAFEADLVHGTATSSTKPAAVAGFVSSDAVISAPAMTSAEIAAKSEEEEREKRRTLADIQIEDEREDATRALETEFEVMADLEARARKLRERREALRLQQGTEAASSATDAQPTKSAASLGKENAAALDVEDDDDDDDDDEMEDDWAGFRFRG